MRPPSRSSARPAMPRPPPKQPGQSSGGSPGSPVRSASVTSRSPGSRLPASKSDSGPPGSLPVMAEEPKPYDGRGPGRLAAGRDTQPGKTHADRGTHKGHQCQEGLRTWPARQRPSWTWRADPVHLARSVGLARQRPHGHAYQLPADLGSVICWRRQSCARPPRLRPGGAGPEQHCCRRRHPLGSSGDITCCLLRRGVR